MAATTVQKGSLRKPPAPKNTLAAPFNLKWQSLDKDSCTLILDHIKSTFPPVLAKKPPQKRKRLLIEDARDKGTLDERDIQLLRDAEERKQLMTSIVVGINEVTKAMEKDTLALALVCRSLQPAVMTNHLMLLAATRRTPILGIHCLSDTLSALLRTKHVAAIGFKKSMGNTVFSPLIEFIIPKAEPISVPWLNVWDEKTIQTAAPSQGTNNMPHKQACNDLAKQSAEGMDQSTRHARDLNTCLNCPTKNTESSSPSKTGTNSLKRKQIGLVDGSGNKKVKVDENNSLTLGNKNMDKGDTGKSSEKSLPASSDCSKTKKKRKKKSRELKSKMGMEAKISMIKTSYEAPTVKTLEPRKDKKRKKRKKGTKTGVKSEGDGL